MHIIGFVEFQRRVLVLQPFEFRKECSRIAVAGKKNSIDQNRFKQRRKCGILIAQALPGVRCGKSGNGRKIAAFGAFGLSEFCTGTEHYAGNFFGQSFAVSCSIGNGSARGQTSARETDVCQARSLRVVCNFINSCRKILFKFAFAGIKRKAGDKVGNTVRFQCRTEKTGKNPPFRNCGGNVCIGNLFLRMLFKKHFIGKGKIFKEGFAFAEFGVCTFAGFKCNASFRKPPLNLFDKFAAASLHYVCFIDENECRDAVSAQKPPKGFGMGLNSVGAAYNKHRVIKYAQRAFRFGRKINMPGVSTTVNSVLL